jgi:hypothetical protein
LRKLCYAEPTVSPEKLQPLTLVTRVLSKRVEEVTGDVTCYLEQLINLTPAGQEETTWKVVQE